jgi:hypothetical protein
MKGAGSFGNAEDFEETIVNPLLTNQLKEKSRSNSANSFV